MVTIASIPSTEISEGIVYPRAKDDLDPQVLETSYHFRGENAAHNRTRAGACYACYANV